MSFSQKIKTELQKLRETGKEYKNALSYGISYGVDKTDLADGLIDEKIYSGDEEIAGLFLRGVFISCGTITDPNKEYHLELIPPSAGKCTELLEFISEHGITMRKSLRKKQTFIYCKDSEQIADFLTLIGAMRYSMEIMNVKIIKELRNNVNRAVNCEAANIGKTAHAAMKQLEDIERIHRVKGLNSLPEELREVAQARRAHADFSLKELADKLNISKSGINHRLKRISAIAAELGEEK